MKNAGGYGIVIFDKRSEETHMNDRLLDYAIRIQSIAQAVVSPEALATFNILANPFER